MNSAQPTAGKWQVHDIGGDQFQICANSLATVLAVTTLRPTVARPGENEANARLLAAAPAFREALINCRTSAIAETAECEGKIGQTPAERLHEINAIVAAALAI